MEKIKQTLSFGCPLKIYQFTGEFQGILQGFYIKESFEKPVYAPIYVDYEGKRLVDMSQIRPEEEKDE